MSRPLIAHIDLADVRARNSEEIGFERPVAAVIVTSMGIFTLRGTPPPHGLVDYIVRFCLARPPGDIEVVGFESGHQSTFFLSALWRLRKQYRFVATAKQSRIVDLLVWPRDKKRHEMGEEPDLESAWRFRAPAPERDRLRNKLPQGATP